MVYMIKFFMEGHLVFKASTASYQYGNITLQCLHCIKLIASLYYKKTYEAKNPYFLSSGPYFNVIGNSLKL